MNRIVILSGIEFVFRFLPVFLLIYYIVPARARDAVLLAGSVVFYAAGEPLFVLLLAGLTLINHLLGRRSFVSLCAAEERAWQERQNGHRRTRRKIRGRAGYMILAIALDAAVLVVLKVLALQVDSSLLPLGLSFYIFKMISYQADIYSGKVYECPTFVKTAAYFMMFPQITQGPIMRYADGFDKTSAPLPSTEENRDEADLAGAGQTAGGDPDHDKEQDGGSAGRYIGRHVGADSLERGLVYMTAGLGMKILIADRIGILWNEIGKIGYESISTPLAWLGAYGYTCQLYFDFWGYSLIAGGVGVMLGFPFIENFIHPYAASGIGDFYRRWHATLGSWFRDYIYIPLGGSRAGTVRTIRNLMIVWLLTGFWHGGTLNFIIWGVVLGLMIVLEKYPLRRLLHEAPVIGRLGVWILIPLTWVVFAIPDLKQLGVYFARLFPFFGIGQTADPGDVLRMLSMFGPYFAASAVLCVPKVFDSIIAHRRNVLVIMLLTIVFWASAFYMATSSGNTFMYFSF